MSLASGHVKRFLLVALSFGALTSNTVPVAEAQIGAWGNAWSRGRGTARLSGDIGYSAPPWHYQRMPPGTDPALRQQERFYHDLDRMHRFQTREERYESDFRNRYSSGDPFYHSYPAYRGFAKSPPPEPVFPPSYPHYGRSEASLAPQIAGLAYSRSDRQRRQVHDDADVADLLRAAATRLNHSLSRMRDGEVWLGQLQPRRVVATIDRAEFPGVLSDLVQHYDAVANTPRLVLVAEAQGFRDTHQLLTQYVRLQSRFPNPDFAAAEHPGHATPWDEHAWPTSDLPTSDLPTNDRVPPHSASWPSDEPVELNSPESASSRGLSSDSDVQWLPVPRGERDIDHSQIGDSTPGSESGD